VGRPDDAGYPARGIVKGEYVYIRNFHPERWPANNPDVGYTDTDKSPTKTYILNDRRKNGNSFFWDQCFGKRPAEELYNASGDPHLLENLAENPDFHDLKSELEHLMNEELKAEGDPRMFGKGDVFDKYPVANERGRDFYNRFMRGEDIKAGWVLPTDIEKEKLD
jgi:hypothetical protein